MAFIVNGAAGQRPGVAVNFAELPRLLNRDS
jgi:hypothetical protein